MNNNIKIEMNAYKDNIIFSRGAIASFLVNLPLPINFLNEIKTVISEAVTNAIVHGYINDESKKVYLEFDITDNILTMIIKDKGIGIEDIEKAKEPLFTTKETEDRAGLGFTIMEVFMDSLKVTSVVGKETKVEMIKKYHES